MDVHIRDAMTSDADAISSLVCSLACEHISPSLGDAGLDTLLASMDVARTRQRIADGWLHLCTFDGDNLLGVIVVKPPLHLYHLFVRSDLHRTGIGTSLLRVADDRVFKSTRSRLATVNSSINAVAAYKRFGFVIDGDIADVHGVRFQPMVRQDDGSRS